jgi:probable addiction module antidote protein
MKTPRTAKLVKLEDAVTFAPFDAAEYLDSEEMVAAYLSEAAASGDEQLFLTALADIARARSMTKLAKDSGLGRESLYKSLRAGAKPRFDTISAIMRGMGLQLSVVTAKTGPTSTGGVAKVARASKTRPGTKIARRAKIAHPSPGKTSAGRSAHRSKAGA